jgi:hypothetical protein
MLHYLCNLSILKPFSLPAAAAAAANPWPGKHQLRNTYAWISQTRSDLHHLRIMCTCQRGMWENMPCT